MRNLEEKQAKLIIQKTNKENKLLRIIDSTFLKTQEEYIFDGKFH